MMNTQHTDAYHGRNNLHFERMTPPRPIPTATSAAMLMQRSPAASTAHWLMTPFEASRKGNLWNLLLKEGKRASKPNHQLVQTVLSPSPSPTKRKPKTGFIWQAADWFPFWEQTAVGQPKQNDVLKVGCLVRPSKNELPQPCEQKATDNGQSPAQNEQPKAKVDGEWHRSAPWNHLNRWPTTWSRPYLNLENLEHNQQWKDFGCILRQHQHWTWSPTFLILLKRRFKLRYHYLQEKSFCSWSWLLCPAIPPRTFPQVAYKLQMKAPAGGDSLSGEQFHFVRLSSYWHSQKNGDLTLRKRLVLGCTQLITHNPRAPPRIPVLLLIGRTLVHCHVSASKLAHLWKNKKNKNKNERCGDALWGFKSLSVSCQKAIPTSSAWILCITTIRAQMRVLLLLRARRRKSFFSRVWVLTRIPGKVGSWVDFSQKQTHQGQKLCWF